MTRHIALLVALVMPVALTAQSLPTKPAAMSGGGEVSMRLAGDLLHVNVTGPRAGLASLCAGDESLVRILHASAAVGEAAYEKSGDRWIRKSNFEWKLRDSRKTPTADADPQRVLQELGWVANASAAGAPVRTFTVRLTNRVRFIGVTFLSTDEPMAISYWPQSMTDGCREIKVAQGYLPETADFDPATWLRVR